MKLVLDHRPSELPGTRPSRDPRHLAPAQLAIDGHLNRRNGYRTMERFTLLWPSAIGLTLAVGLTGTIIPAEAQAPAKPEASSTSSQRSRQEPTIGVSINVKPLPPGIPGDLPQWLCPSSEYVLLPLTSEYCLQGRRNMHVVLVL
jgi:hypothetical protein